MKIITRSNFNDELFIEKTIAENVDSKIGSEMVSSWNNLNHNEHSYLYLDIVSDDYVNYNGYKILLGDDYDTD